MTVFFNLNILDKESKCDPYRFLALLEYHTTGKLPKSYKSKYKPSSVSLTGFSFILDPIPLFNLKHVDIHFIIQYIKLAALRDYALYRFNQFKALDTTFFPDLNTSVIRSNPLLTIAQKYINFKYEDIYKWH